MKGFIENVKELNSELAIAIKQYKELIALEKETIELEKEINKKYAKLRNKPYQMINQYGRVTGWKVVR